MAIGANTHNWNQLDVNPLSIRIGYAIVNHRHSLFHHTTTVPRHPLGILNVPPLRDVQTVQELYCTHVSDALPNLAHTWVTAYLSNILVLDPAYLLNICRTLAHILQRIARQLQLVLLVLADLDIHTRQHGNPPYDLLANEISVTMAKHQLHHP